MEKGKISGTARAIVFREDDTLKEYIVKEPTQIGIGEEQITVSCKGESWTVDAAGVTDEIKVNGNLVTEKERIEVSNRDILQFHGNGVTDIVLEKTEAEDLQWKRMPLSESFPIIRVRRVESEQDQEEADAEAEISSDDIHEAEIRLEDGIWKLSDVHTVRGIFVNGEKITHSRNLQPMDVIRAGNTLFFFGKKEMYYSHTIFQGNNLSIHIEERSVKSFFKKHVLLQDINLTIKPGKMVLILGGSGAGKTTFVNAVTGYEKAKAQILQGGVDVYENYGKMKHSIGFVPQQDLLREDDTVLKTLENAAEMRLPKNFTAKQREEQVEKVLDLFGLTVQKNELVRKMSGGQRKRLSIGVEFISDPKLFFLDEPDSGLDGVMARELMENLRQIADENRIVLVITHTPDRVIDLFDQVIVLAKGTSDHIGHLAFFGDIADARAFFGKETMEDIVLAVNAKDEGGEGRADEFIRKFKEMNPEGKTDV